MFVKGLPNGKNWLAGVISQVKGPLSYIVLLNDGRLIHRHVDHTRPHTCDSQDLEISITDIEIPTARSATTAASQAPPRPPDHRSQVYLTSCTSRLLSS